MNKAAIKNFAIWARSKLIEDVRYKARLIGITEDGIDEPMPNSLKDLLFFDIGNDNEPYAISGEAIEQRKKLIAALEKRVKLSDYKTAFDSMAEETAYTWFNRLIAIRFMEVNQYLPSNLRVLSSSGNKLEPELVSKPFDSGFKFSDAEKTKITKWKEDNNAAELFTFLFIKQCNELNAVLPELFEKLNDYSELLINLNYTDSAGVVRRLITDIPEDDFKEAVEIIGWLYQYYNTEPKAAVDAYVKTGKKVAKKDIPAKTQLFTPDWIVRYMVENSLGRLWIEGHPNEELKKNWKYFLDEAEQEDDVKKQLDEIRQEYKAIKPEDIKVIDPCMGSGHILVYIFTVLMQIYESQGYNPRDAAKLILEKNLYGLDIDDRAWQLAYFAVLMKARQYNRSIFFENIKPHLYAVQESNEIDAKYLQFFGEGMDDKKRDTAFHDIKTLVEIFNDGKDYGSILKIPNFNFKLMRTFINKYGEKAFLPDSTELFPEIEQQHDLLDLYINDVNYTQTRLNELIDIAEILHDKYHAVVTNPPYMGLSYMNSHLSNYVKREYENSKGDVSTIFMEQSIFMCKKNGYMAMINIPVWMFISSYEKLRQTILEQNMIINMLHFGRGIFGSDFGTTSFVIGKAYCKNFIGTYRRLFIKQGAVDTVAQKERWFFDNKGIFNTKSDNFINIPGSPVAYWVSKSFLQIFQTFEPFKINSEVITGMTTGENNIFLRLWYEVNIINCLFSATEMPDLEKTNKYWIPYSKGGERRNWLGNYEYIVNWKRKDEFNRSKTTLQRLYLKEGITWPFITSGTFSARYLPNGFLWDVTGSPCFFKDKETLFYCLGFLCSKLANYIINIVNPTLAVQAIDIEKLPLKIEEESRKTVEQLVQQNISLSRTDWDSFETSWDFKRHPLIPKCPISGNSLTLSELFTTWQQACEERFQTLKSNEEELNRIFIEIYGLQDELTPDVEDKDVTVRKADLGREIRSLISYAVGCLFGRYSLDIEGLAYAGGDWDNDKYKTIILSKNNTILITDEEYFNDDIANQFIGFIKTVYGEETLEDNLNFIAQALNNRGGNSRDTIRGYFLNDFYKDHVKIYQKRPIYWLFDSGKENGFKALIYMHRYHADTIGNLRIEYLHTIQNTYENEIARMQRIIKTSSFAAEKSKSQKKLEKLQKQLWETKAYDVKINHLALSRIEIDLDDGVKHNYEKIQTAQDGKKYEILGKIG
jgi:type II restriction/modification system DNA methylase subunit YeeA